MTEKHEIKDCNPEDDELHKYYDDNCLKEEVTGKFVHIVLLQLIGDDSCRYEISIDQSDYKKLGYVSTNFDSACHRILCSTKDRLPKVIKLRKEYSNQEILINYSDIEWTKTDCNNNGIHGIQDITERKLYYGPRHKRHKNVYEIYQECIKIHVGYRLSEPDIVHKLLNAMNYFGTDGSNPNPMESIKQIEIPNQDVTRMPILWETERNMQIYFHLFKKNAIMTYGVTNDTVKHSKVFFGKYFGRQGSDKFMDKFRGPIASHQSTEEQMNPDLDVLELHSLTDLTVPNWGATYDFYLPFYYNNLTEIIHLHSRYNFIKTQCLYGQDNEFNIFRSLCFVYSDNQEMVVRLSIGVLCLILQICLTIGIVMQVYTHWDLDEMFDKDVMIITISLLVFAFISYLYTFTVIRFWQFYDNCHFVAEIPLMIPVLDFISNILIGLMICCIAFAYLLQSETITDVVLNSFALTFVIELDDLANLFEADEEHLLRTDWDNVEMLNGDYDEKIGKRQISVLSLGQVFSAICLVLVSPLFILYAFGQIIYGLICHLKHRKKHNWDYDGYDLFRGIWKILYN